MNDDAAHLVERSRGLLRRGHPGDAAELSRQALKQDPGHAEALYLLAVCCRYLKRPEEARAALVRLESARPGYGRAFQEQGHLARADGDVTAAISAYRRAVAANPALPASWGALADLLRDQGDLEGADRAMAHRQRLAALPAELLSVSSFLHEGRLYKAERLCRAFLERRPHHLEAMRLLAAVGTELQVLDDAEFLLESALAFDPEFLLARVDYVRVLQRRQKFDRAVTQAHRLREAQPGNVAFAVLYADACAAAGDQETALAEYDRVLDRQPLQAGVHLARGHVLKTVGRHGEAVAAYRTARRCRGSFGDAYWSLANLKTYRFDDAELDAMRDQVLQPGMARVDRYHLYFALGKALEDRGEHAEAFDCFVRGNALKREELDYDPRRLQAEFERQRTVCDGNLFARRRNAGCSRADPIFIVGLPRAGSTLLEQVLASHSQVDGTFELPNVLALVHRLRGRRPAGDPRYPRVLADLDAGALTRLGERYLEDTRMHRATAPFFTDKMPNNFRHLGFIHLILPDARIIDARRHSLACCVSAFKQLFAEGQEFSYDLTDLGRYYRGYVELMDHWATVLPAGRILRVQHEDVVADLEGQVRRLLDFLGLPFESACLDFHRTERSVRTASSEQVRRPIYREGLDQWRHYESWLTPLKTALGPALER